MLQISFRITHLEGFRKIQSGKKKKEKRYELVEMSSYLKCLDSTSSSSRVSDHCQTSLVVLSEFKRIS